METRKVQVTGGSTYTVSIPKKWATENGVSTGSLVEFHAEDDVLLLVPRSESGESEGTLDVSGLETEQELTQSVMTMYVGGFDVIRIEATRIPASQRRAVRHVTQGLVGLEVIEETGSRVVLQDLLDPAELSVRDAITRMRPVSLTMLADAVEALVEDDDDLAESVVERDDEVDRLWYMVSRVFRTVLRDPAAANEFGFSRETAFDFQTAARQLERIGDHAVKIARVAGEVDGLPEQEARVLTDLLDPAVNVPEMAMDALLAEDADEARQLVDQAHERQTEVDAKAREADRHVRRLDDPERAQRLGLVVDSLSRTGNYGTNVAEAALQKSAPGRSEIR